MSRYIVWPPKKPRRLPTPGQFISKARDDYVVDTGRLQLNPEKLGRIFRAAESGVTRELYEAFSAVEEDAHVHSVLAKRRRRVLARPMQISPAIEDDKRAQEAAELCRGIIEGDQGADGIAGWREAISVALDAVGKGFSLQQIHWDTQTPGHVMVDGKPRALFARPTQLLAWPQRDCIVGDPDNPETASDEVRIVVNEDQHRGEPLEPDQWVNHVAKARNAPLAKASLLRIIMWWWLFKHFGTRDWVIFCERYGTPLRQGEYPPNTSDTDRNALLAAVLTVGHDAGVVVPEGCKITLIEAAAAKGDGKGPYYPLIETANFEISKAVLGGTLTTESGDRGARSLGEVHERAEADIAEQDGLALAETLKQQLLKPIVKYNLGEGYPVPLIAFVSGEQEPLKERAERDEILATKIKLPMTKAYFYETYGVTVPEADDELVNPPSPEPAASPPSPEPAAEDPPSEEDDEMDEQLNSAALSMAETILGADQVSTLQAMGTPLPAIVHLAEERAKKKSIPWVTPTS